MAGRPAGKNGSGDCSPRNAGAAPLGAPMPLGPRIGPSLLQCLLARQGLWPQTAARQIIKMKEPSRSTIREAHLETAAAGNSFIFADPDATACHQN